MNEEALFSGAQAALQFAYGYPSNQVQRSSASKMATTPSKGGRGLSGVDGAAQAGIVRDLIFRNVSYTRAAILVCRCAPHHLDCSCGAICCSRKKKNFEWEEAISLLVGASIAELSGILSKRGLREAVIKRYFGMRAETDERLDRAWAKEFSSSREVVSAHVVNIKRWMKAEETRAWAEAEEVLKESGILG